MTTQIFSNPTTTAPLLSRFITEIPQKTADLEKRNATLYNLAAKICLVAFLTIVAGVLAISVGVPLAIPPAIGLSLLLSTIPLQIGFQSFMIRSAESFSRASQAKEIATEFSRIQSWKQPEIEAFFKEHKLTFAKVPMDLLKRLNPKEPLSALLPAIATYNYFRTQAVKLHLEHVENLYNTDPSSVLRYQGRAIGWHLLEYRALPAALDAAVVLQTIADPTRQGRLKDLGSCHAKDFAERRFDQLLDGIDEYFVFNEGNRPSLNLAELQEILSKHDFDTIRSKLFDSQIKR